MDKYVRMINARKELSRIILLLWLSLAALSSQAATSGSYVNIKTFTVEMQNASVKDVLDYIENNSKFIFFYTSGSIDTKRKVSVSVSTQPITTLLDQIFKNTNVKYDIDGYQIALKKADGAAASSAPSKASPAKRRVTGTVVDASNDEPLIGAPVTFDKNTPGVVTDIDGYFSIEMPAEGQLYISYLGFQPATVKPGDKNELTVRLNPDTNVLDEVVVVGYGTTTRKNLTTSIATVKTDKISKAANSSVSSMLLGRAAGLQATVSSTQPGGDINISIRGGGNPIYVVDGVIMPNSSLEAGSGETGLPDNVKRSALAGLNPGDIESIEILKDASAAIYGIGAADGVVLITTKKGAEGKPTITYEGSYSIQKRYNYGLNRLNSVEYMNLVNVFDKEKYLLNNNQYPYGNLAYDGKWTPVFSQDQIDNATDTNWQDYVLKTGHINNHSLTISGGTQKFKYYLGVNYFNEDGIIRNAGMERYSLRTNVTAQLFPFLRLSTIINLNKNKYENGLVGGDTGNQGNSASGSLYSALHYPTYLPVYDKNGEYTIFGRVPNPVATLDIIDESRQSSYYANFAMDVDIIKNMLSVRLVYGLNHETGRRTSYIPKDVYFGLVKKSRGSLGYIERQYETMEGMINFNHNFWNALDFNAVVGMGRYVDKGNDMTVSYQNANDMIQDTNLGAADGPFVPSSYKYENEKRSQFARASFILFDKYVLAATVRRDGTDKFFDNKKYSWFPSVSGAWKISQEKFLRNLTWLNLLKVRASYGVTGSDNLGTSLYGTVGVSREDIKFSNGSVTYVPFVLQGGSYDDVTWQKTTMKNFGIDFVVLNNRLSGNFDIFRNDVTNMLGTAYTSLLNMYPTRPVNGAHYKRTGVELSLNSENIRTSDFTWTTSLALSHYRANWVERMPNYDYKTYQQRENEPMSAYYYYNTTGIINADRSNMPESQRSLPIDAQKPGFPIIDDRNGNGVIDEGDIYMDDLLPKLYYGFGNTFIYKNWDLDIYMYGQLGVEKYNNTKAANCSAGNLSSGISAANPTDYAFTAWNSQTNPNGTTPGVATKDVTMPGNAGIKLFYEKADFLRVRNITLGYTFDARKWKCFKGYMQSLRLYADVQNPFTFTGFTGDDPEIVIASSLLSGCNYPQLRTYSFGAKIIF